MVLEIKYIGEDGVTPPHRGSDGAAAWDLHAAEDYILKPYEYARIKTGLKVELPVGHVLLVVPRSGFSFKNQIISPGGIGVCDEDYRGEVWITACWQPPTHEAYKVILGQEMWAGTMRQVAKLEIKENLEFRVTKNDRIAQALLIKYEEQDWRQVNELSATKRDAGGFGSTGLRTEHARS